MKKGLKLIGFIVLVIVLYAIATLIAQEAIAIKKLNAYREPVSSECREYVWLYQKNPELISELHEMSTGSIKDPNTNKLIEINKCMKKY